MLALPTPHADSFTWLCGYERAHGEVDGSADGNADAL